MRGSSKFEYSLILIVLALLLFVSCDRVKVTSLTKIISRSVVVKDSIRNYFRENILIDTTGVVLIHLAPIHDSIELIITSTVLKDDIQSNSFMMLDDSIPLVLLDGENRERLNREDSIKMWNSIERYLFETKIDSVGNVLELPPNYNPVTWRIVFYKDKIVKTQVLN